MHPQLKDLPFFLETPHDSLSGYAEEEPPFARRLALTRLGAA